MNLKTLLFICAVAAFGCDTTLAFNDSIRVSRLLDSVMLNPAGQSSYDASLDSILSKYKNKQDQLTTLTVMRAKFELRRGNFDLANQHLKKLLSAKTLSEKNYAVAIQLRGSLKAVSKDFQGAIQDYEVALRLFDDLKLKLEAAHLKNNIANIFFNLNDFESAYSYAKESFETTYALNDTIYYPQIAAILAISEAKIYKLNDAQTHALLAIEKGAELKVPVAIIIGEYAMGDVLSQQQRWEEALERYEKTVALSVELRLTQYEIFGRIGLLSCYNALENYQLAVEQGTIVTTLCEKANLHYADYTVYQKLSIAYNQLGYHKEAFDALNKANNLYRNYSSIENKKAIQELLTIYETEKKEKELSHKELQLSHATNWILVLVLVLLIIIGIIVWWKRRNKHKLEEMKRASERRQVDAFVEGEQIERQRIAADIHDGVAGTLTGLALQLQQVKSLDEVQQLGTHLQRVRNEIRSISKNLLPFNLQQEGWNAAFLRYANTVQSTDFQVFFQSHYEEQQLNKQRGMVVYRIVQELIQNTLKHAKATECELFISEEDDILLIQYSDNGKGTNLEELERGNGWQSIRKRVEAIEGNLELPPNSLDGFKVDIILDKLK